jgi:glycosyltransferase involved in cell wall biosynthesis
MRPLISCITPITEDRRRFLPALLDSFRRQTYTEKELVIVGDCYAENLTTPGEAIYCFPASHDLTVGAKLNLCNSLAHGQFIAHFDSDDISAPERLEDQVQRLTNTEKSVTGYRCVKVIETRIVNGKSDTTWKHTCPLDDVLGASFMYRRNWWASHPFQDTQANDKPFWNEALNAGETVSADGFELLCCVNHSGNVSGRVVSVGHRWIEQ